MTNDTFIPCDILKPYIRHFIISDSLPETTYKVLPDTGVVIGFQYKGKLSFLDNGKEVQLSSSGVTGLRDQYRVFKNSPGTGTVLVFFKEAGATSFFRQPVHEIFRESISMENFILRSELVAFEDQLSTSKTNPERIKVVERFLISRMSVQAEDKLVTTALAIIHQNRGNIRIRQLAEQLNISQSPLEKRFRKVVGASPKKFASIIRIKHTITSYHPEKTFTGLGYEAGFYDQAHFIREFRNFTGETPELFFEKKIHNASGNFSKNDFLQSIPASATDL